MKHRATTPHMTATEMKSSLLTPLELLGGAGGEAWEIEVMGRDTTTSDDMVMYWDVGTGMMLSPWVCRINSPIDSANSK